MPKIQRHSIARLGLVNVVYQLNAEYVSLLSSTLLALTQVAQKIALECGIACTYYGPLAQHSDMSSFVSPP